MPVTRSLRAIALALALAIASPTHAADWVQTSLPAGWKYALASGPSGELYATSGGAIHRSLDEGLTWTAVGHLPANSFAHVLAVSPSGAVYAGDFALGVFRSVDGGATWSGNLVDEGCNGLAVSADDVVFAGLTYTGHGKVHRSADAGAHWQAIELPGATPSFATECFAFGSGGAVYAGTIDGFFRSSDDGLTWQGSSTGLAGRHVRTLAVAANGHLFVHTLFPAQIDGLYRSVDGGTSWQRRAGNAPYFSDLLAAPDGSLLGASEAHVVRSLDEGLVWTDVAAGLPAFEQLTSLVVTASGHLVVGGSRVHRLEAAVLGAPRPTAPGLALANHPNPFAGRTRFAFTLPRAAAVDLAVFDLAGRRLTTLALGPHAAGEHAVAFEAGTLPAGVYHARLLADGAAVTRRVLLLD